MQRGLAFLNARSERSAHAVKSVAGARGLESTRVEVHLRIGSGMAVGRPGPRPAKLLELYEFEACPFCRKAREALSILDLEAMIYPCPKGGPRFRADPAGAVEEFVDQWAQRGVVELPPARRGQQVVAADEGDDLVGSDHPRGHVGGAYAPRFQRVNETVRLVGQLP